jgi:hypothetical protein
VLYRRAQDAVMLWDEEAQADGYRFDELKTDRTINVSMICDCVDTSLERVDVVSSLRGVLLS